MAISRSSFETFISRLKTEKPPSQKPGYSTINMHSQDSFDPITAASTKGIDEHLSELLATTKAKVEYSIPDCYYTNPELRREFVQKLIKKEKPEAIHQYFSQLANKFSTEPVAYYNIMNAGLALQKRVCLEKIKRLQKQNYLFFSSPRQHLLERRDAKKQLERIQNEQHQLSSTFEKLAANKGFSEPKSLYSTPETTTASHPVSAGHSLQTTKSPIDLSPEKNQHPINSFKDELDTTFDMDWNFTSKTASQESLNTSLNRTDESLKRQETNSFYSPLSNSFSHSDTQPSSRSSYSIPNEPSQSVEQFPFLVENEEGGFSKLTLKRDSIASINDDAPSLHRVSSPDNTKLTEAESFGSIPIAYQPTAEELATTVNQTAKHSNKIEKDQILLPRRYQP